MLGLESQRNYINTGPIIGFSGTKNVLKTGISNQPNRFKDVSSLIEIGAPNLRTIWIVQAVTMSFGWKIRVRSNKEPETNRPPQELLLGFKLLSPEIITDVSLTNIKIPEVKSTPVEKSVIAVTEPRKVFALELFSPIQVSGNALAGQFELWAFKEEEFSNETVEFTFTEPILNTSVEQKFYPSPR